MASLPIWKGRNIATIGDMYVEGYHAHEPKYNTREHPSSCAWQKRDPFLFCTILYRPA